MRPERDTMMLRMPPGRRSLCASRTMLVVACVGSSCSSKQLETRSTVPPGRPVFSAAACRNSIVSVLPSWPGGTIQQAVFKGSLIRLTCSES